LRGHATNDPERWYFASLDGKAVINNWRSMAKRRPADLPDVNSASVMSWDAFEIMFGRPQSDCKYILMWGDDNAMGRGLWAGAAPVARARETRR
jgi:hypothetical protein